jgi:hypothetical protein
MTNERSLPGRPRSRSRGRRATRAVLVVLVLGMGAAGAAALGERLSDGGSADALRPAAASRAEAKPAPRPARPRRAIVPDVEVVVNIPAGRLEVRDGGRVVKSYAVSVGQAKYSTPVGGYLLATVVWNPWWHPPQESAWAKDRKPTPPGPGNPMGRVKLNIDELYYIHGTTAEGRLGAPASHGCIRMANRDVVDLARRLYRIADPGMGAARLAALSAADGRTRESVLARSVRMRVVYQVARVSADTLRVLPDVYGRLGSQYADQVRRTLAEAGYTEPVPPAAIARLLQSATTEGGGAFALSDLPSLHPREAAAPAAEPGVRLLGTPAPASAALRDDTTAAAAPDGAAPRHPGPDAQGAPASRSFPPNSTSPEKPR